LPDLKVLENGLKYHIRSEVLQKVGFYYDHRENRLQLMEFLSRFNNRLEKGVDLFSYAGAWGMSALKAGVKHIDFVDQGDLSHEVLQSLKLNNYSECGSFHRGDVFKFLDQAIERKTFFDVIFPVSTSD
jgi:23S rRNA (cytosine1962-C5)-methyltransferase